MNKQSASHGPSGQQQQIKDSRRATKEGEFDSQNTMHAERERLLPDYLQSRRAQTLEKVTQAALRQGTKGVVRRPGKKRAEWSKELQRVRDGPVSLENQLGSERTPQGSMVTG